MTYFGPSAESIHETIMLQEAWFDDAMDHDGELTVPWQEYLAVGDRIDQLYDLTRLTQPVTIFGQCDA